MKNRCTLNKEVQHTYVVTGKTCESDRVFTLSLTLSDGSIPLYQSGQFITVYFPELYTPEGKAYSISSAPTEKGMTITVKIMGEFSSRLSLLMPGNTLVGSLPYGYFFTESKDNSLVMIAGGIGITPFRSMIIDTLMNNPDRYLTLFYSSKTVEDLTFKKEFEKLQEKYPTFSNYCFVTRERGTNQAYMYHRMRVVDILEHSIRGNVLGQEFLICGSVQFVGDMWRGLRAAGIPEDLMYTEAFFSH